VFLFVLIIAFVCSDYSCAYTLYVMFICFKGKSAGCPWHIHYSSCTWFVFSGCLMAGQSSAEYLNM